MIACVPCARRALFDLALELDLLGLHRAADHALRLAERLRMG